MSGNRCIIIGSGLGGLSSGIILALNGYDVTVLEQGAQIGGCLQCFTRNGLNFETGMHFLGSLDEGQSLNRLFRYLGILDKVEFSRLDATGYDIVHLGGCEYRFANGRDPFIGQMSQYFPSCTDDIVRYCDLIDKASRAYSIHSLNLGQSDSRAVQEYQTHSINAILDSAISNPLLRDVLVGTIPLYAAVKDRTPFMTHAFIMDFFNKSAFRTVGGSGKIASALACRLESLGGRILALKKARRIVCDEAKAVGVETDSGDFYPADFVISSLHPVATMNLVDSKLIRPVYRERLSSLPNTSAPFTVYLSFKENAMPYCNSNHYCYTSESPWGGESYDEQTWPKNFMYMHYCHKDNAKFAKAGELIAYMSMDELRQWDNSASGHRGDDYLAFKERKAQKLIMAADREFPGLKDAIDCHYTSTPLTYRDFTGTPDGSMYGLIKDVSMGAASHVSHRTKIPNLLLTGQSINSHGMLGVMISSVVTCSALTGESRIIDQINKE
jgi:all-trans-retinol 13,14-reductase